MKIRKIEPIASKSFVKIARGEVSLVDYRTEVETKFATPLEAWQEKEKRELDILV